LGFISIQWEGSCCFSLFNLKVSHGTQQQMRQSQRCSRYCSGVLVVASLEETRWGALVSSRGLVVASLEGVQGGMGGCSCGLVVASLKGARGLLSRFDRVYPDYITQGCPGCALAVAMSPRARCFCFPTVTVEIICHSVSVSTAVQASSRGHAGIRIREGVDARCHTGSDSKGSLHCLSMKYRYRHIIEQLVQKLKNSTNTHCTGTRDDLQQNKHGNI
jgi:hypothetical protein